jgi:serine/threonine protein kinase
MIMDPERWQEIERLYHLARKKDKEARDSFLAQECAGDTSLRTEVESLLASRFEAEDFIEASAMDVAAKAIAAEHAEMNAHLVGRTLLHYWILQILGQGGMGDVFLAEDTNLSRKVAVKLLPNVFSSDTAKMARFEREAKLLASLNHPNIAAIYELEQAEGTRFMVMEWVWGETLEQRLAHGPLSLEEALNIGRQLAEGLAAAHEKGIIHRVLKPANVMIIEGERVKILDFGLSKAIARETQAIKTSLSSSGTSSITQPGVIVGTVAYMSPELAKGNPVDKRADIWAFGVLLYEMVTGKQPFTGSTVGNTLTAILTEEPDWK